MTTKGAVKLYLWYQTKLSGHQICISIASSGSRSTHIRTNRKAPRKKVAKRKRCTQKVCEAERGYTASLWSMREWQLTVARSRVLRDDGALLLLLLMRISSWRRLRLHTSQAESDWRPPAPAHQFYQRAASWSPILRLCTSQQPPRRRPCGLHTFGAGMLFAGWCKCSPLRAARRRTVIDSQSLNTIFSTWMLFCDNFVFTERCKNLTQLKIETI